MRSARKKELTLIVSFPTTTEAMKMEQYCMQNNLPGRLIPIPREITAGCGVSWKAAPDDKELLETAMLKNKICFENIYLLVI